MILFYILFLVLVSHAEDVAKRCKISVLSSTFLEQSFKFTPCIPGKNFKALQHSQGMHAADHFGKIFGVINTPSDLDSSRATHLIPDYSCLYINPKLRAPYIQKKNLYSKEGKLAALSTALLERGFKAPLVLFQPHPLQMACAPKSTVVLMVPELRSYDKCNAQKSQVSRVYLPYVTSARPVMKPLSERPTLAALGASCRWRTTPGKAMRYSIIKALKDENGTRVHCTDGVDKPIVYSHKETQQILATSRFCFVVAGDTPSSRRISEVIINGCIPVFIGPHWHSTPMHDSVPYANFSLFYRVRAFEGLKDSDPESAHIWKQHGEWIDALEPLSLSSSLSAGRAQRGSSKGSNTRRDRPGVVTVDSPLDVLEDLRRIPEGRVRALLENLRVVQHRFSYADPWVYRYMEERICAVAPVGWA